MSNNVIFGGASSVVHRSMAGPMGMMPMATVMTSSGDPRQFEADRLRRMKVELENHGYVVIPPENAPHVYVPQTIRITTQ